MEQMQFTAIVLMALLTATLMLLMHQVGQNQVLNRSRWLLACGTGLLLVHFLLQYTLHLRNISISGAVALNLIFFMPSSWLFNLAALYLECWGKLNRYYKWAGLLTYLITLVLLSIAIKKNNGSLTNDTPIIRTAEWLGAIIYALTQIYYIVCHFRQLRRLRRSLRNYYDRDVSELLRWMKSSVVQLTLMVGMVPLIIFKNTWFTALYGIFTIGAIYYWIISFVCYSVSNDAREVMKAPQNESEENLDIEELEKENIDHNNLMHVEQVVQQWLDSGSYCNSGITMPMAAREMHIPQRLFRLWYQTKGFDSYSDWLQMQRVMHAKQLLKEHPDWSLETIAVNCGFSSRSYFHHIFQKITGKTPTEYIK